MANNPSNGTLTLIDDLVQELKENETLAARKANTVVSSIGTTLTLLATGGTYLIEKQTDLPPWVTVIVLVLGGLATTFKISKTPNGITDSTATKLQAALTDRIDVHHLDELREQQFAPTARQPYPVQTQRPIPYSPPQPAYQEQVSYQDQPTEQHFPVDRALDLRAGADSIVTDLNDRQ